MDATQLATTVCAAGFWEWWTGDEPPSVADFTRFAAGRWPGASAVVDEMVRLEYEARSSGPVIISAAVKPC